MLTLASFQLFPQTTLSERGLHMRLWYSTGFLDVNDLTVLGGNGSTGFYIPFDCSITDSIVLVEAEDIFTTLDANVQNPQSIQVFARLYSNNTPKDWVFTGWVIPSEAEYPGGVITKDQLTIYNEGANTLANPPTTYLTEALTIAYFNTLTTNNNASNIVKGITYLDVAPAVPTHPTAVGTNSTLLPTAGQRAALVGTSGTPSSLNPYVTTVDPRIPAVINVKGAPYYAVGNGIADDTAAIQAAVNALSWTRGGRLIVPEGRYKITSRITLPRVQQFGIYSNVTIEAYGAIFEPTAAAQSVFYYHPSTQTINDNVIYNRITFLGGTFKASSRTAGQTGIDISSCEHSRFQDIDFTNMNGIHLRTAYGTVIEGCNVQVSNEYGFKIEGGDWTGALPANSPSNGTAIVRSRVIPGSGSLVNFWFINADVSGIEHCISDAPDAVYPGSGNPQYEIVFDNSLYSLGQTNWVRGLYSERPTLPSVAVIGAILNGGVLTLDLIRRFDDATGTVYVDATGSTSNSTILMRAWPRIDTMPTPRFKTASGVQWMFDRVGEAASQFFLNSDWWVSGTVGIVSQWGKFGIVVGGGTADPIAYQLGRDSSSNAEYSMGLARAVSEWFLGTVAGDAVLRLMNRARSIKFGLGDGTQSNDKAVLTIDAGAVGAGNTGILILEDGTEHRVLLGAAGTGPGGSGRALYTAS